MGKHVFTSIDECDGSIHQVDLFGRGKEGDIQRPGKLIVEITTKRELASI